MPGYRSLLLALGIISMGFPSIAQTDLTNTGTLYLSTGTDTLYINGGFNNNAGSSLTNNGRLYITQTLTNNQVSMAAGSGTLLLTGSSLQNVSGSAVFKTYNLVTNNAAGFLLNNNLSVSNLHTFSNGLIGSAGATNFLVYEAGSSYTGDGDSRHVTGWVKKFGNTDFTFPVGDASYERTVAVSNLSASSEIDAHYYINTPNTSNLFTPILLERAAEYWELNKISGGTGQVTLNWQHAKVPMDNVLVIDIMSSQYISGYWTNTGGTASGTVSTTGSITSDPLSTFGPMALGYGAFPIPVKLISFTGERRRGVSRLKWVTENEYDADHFEIQRSSGGGFATIGMTTARNLNSLQEYFFNDSSVLQGIAYYRLKTVDNDGKFVFSKIISLSDDGNAVYALSAVNPAQGEIKLWNRGTQGGEFRYDLYTSGGQLLAYGQVTIQAGGTAVIALPATLAGGIYQLQLSSGSYRMAQKIIIAR